MVNKHVRPEDNIRRGERREGDTQGVPLPLVSEGTRGELSLLRQSRKRKFTAIENPMGNNHISPSKISGNTPILPILDTQATHNDVSRLEGLGGCARLFLNNTAAEINNPHNQNLRDNNEIIDSNNNTHVLNQLQQLLTTQTNIVEPSQPPERVEGSRVYTAEEVEELLRQQPPRTTPQTRVTCPIVPNQHEQVIYINVQMKKDLRLPKFKGQESGVEPFCASLASKKRELIEEGEQNPDREIIRNLSSAMDSDETKVWYNNLAARGGTPTTVEEFCDRLREIFGDSVPLLLVEQKMGEIKQHRTEAINKYTLRMETQATSWGVPTSGEVIKKAFIHGLYYPMVKSKAANLYHNTKGAVTWKELIELADRTQRNSLSNIDDLEKPKDTNTGGIAPVWDRRVEEKLEAMEKAIHSLSKSLEEKEAPKDSSYKLKDIEEKGGKWCDIHKSESHNTDQCFQRSGSRGRGFRGNQESYRGNYNSKRGYNEGYRGRYRGAGSQHQGHQDSTASTSRQQATCSECNGNHPLAECRKLKKRMEEDIEKRIRAQIEAENEAKSKNSDSVKRKKGKNKDKSSHYTPVVKGQSENDFAQALLVSLNDSNEPLSRIQIEEIKLERKILKNLLKFQIGKSERRKKKETQGLL